MHLRVGISSKGPFCRSHSVLISPDRPSTVLYVTISLDNSDEDEGVDAAADFCVAMRIMAGSQRMIMIPLFMNGPRKN
jgi:hypothetical protein